MTTERRLERDLPQILGDLAMGPYPDYIDDVLATTAHRRQRPAWTFPERWLPMVDIARRPVLAPRIPWRSISVAFVIVALLLAAVAVFIGTQPRLPPPFGLARNGLIAYDAGGDIYTANPKTGVATAIVTGPETDVGPRYSPDGTHVVFQRKLDTDTVQLFVAGADGRDLTLVTPEPVVLTKSLQGEPWQAYTFSPDGRSVLIAVKRGSKATISIAQSDGSEVRGLDVGMLAYEPSFRPPDGAEILFVGNGATPGGHALLAVDPVTHVVRTIHDSAPSFDLAGAVWSPDGSQIAFWSWGGPGFQPINARTHVISADGGPALQLPGPPDAVWSSDSTWSNDGTRLIMLRGYTSGFEDVRPVVMPADGSSEGIEIPYPGFVNGACCATFEWAPDDSLILATPTDDLGKPIQQVIIDPETGETRPAPWTSNSDPTWQRLAP